MRVALFHDLPSGGAKRTLHEATVPLARRHHVDAFTLSCADHEFADIRGAVGVHEVFEFRPLRLLESPFGRLNQVLRMADLRRLDHLARRIAERIDAGGYDVALVHPCRFEQSPSVLRYLKTPSVYYCHEPRRVLYEVMPSRPYDDDGVGRRRVLNRLDPLPALYHRTLRRIEQANTRSAGVVLVNSRYTAEAVRRIHGVEALVSYHGVNAERFRPLPIDKQHVVLSVGSLTPLKGFDFLIRAMAHYPPAKRPTLVVASNFQNPLERSFLEQLAHESGVALTLPGAVSDSDLVQLYNQARAVLYAPVREPFGLVPLEAMACAVPVVAVAEGGIPESVVHDRTGLLTERDPAAFAAAVERVVASPEWASRLGENGRADVLRSWTWDRAVFSLEEHLMRQAAREPARSPIPALVH